MASDIATVLVAGLTGTSTAAAAYIGARLQAKTEIKRLEIENKRLMVEGQRLTEGRSEQFGAFRRGVYRGFFDLLDYYPDEETSDEERRQWRKDYDRRLNTLLLTAGPEVLQKVRALDTDKPELFASNEDIRDELLEAMRRELFNTIEATDADVPTSSPPPSTKSALQNPGYKNWRSQQGSVLPGTVGVRMRLVSNLCSHRQDVE